MIFQQKHRSLKIITPLGEDAVQLASFTGEEHLSRLFEFQLQMVSEHDSIRPEDIVGHNVTFAVDLADSEARVFNGYVQRFATGEERDHDQREYSIRVVPWLWFLTQIVDCRIFQGKTVVEIIEEVFALRGYADYEINMRQDHPQHEYCVQYCESDFDFLSRLMEEEGIFYYFRHENGKHVLVLGDSIAAYYACPQAIVDFEHHKRESRIHDLHITAWERAWEFQSGAVELNDYNFKTPNNSLSTYERTLLEFHNGPNFERFEYPAGYPEKAVGRSLARLRMEEIEAKQDLVNGASICMTFSPGAKFTVGNHPMRSEEGKQYVLRSVVHHGHDCSHDERRRDHRQHKKESTYANTFVCFPEDRAYRPERMTRRAMIRGCQTARVTGPANEEIHTDEFGRVKVKFHWDRWGATDDTSSCWIRVSHHHAGAGWGYIDLPRVGEEVIVDFLEGDPDQPIIVGRVYNGSNGVPFALPDEKTRRGYTTKTYEGEGYNELSMDDTKGKEQIRIHAQHNMNTVVRSCQTLAVGADRTDNIGNDDNETVGKNQTLKVGENQKIRIGKMLDVSVGENQHVAIEEHQITRVGKSKDVHVGDDFTLDCQKNIIMTAADSISIGTGQSSILMKKDGTIEINGVNVTVNGSANVTVDAATIASKASGVNNISGMMVNIN
ncbi:MAG: type VI secretion system tip protein TssI/VgrG [Pirellulaceae bacterium]